MDTKACRKCKEVKLLDDFHVANNMKDGRNTMCRTCKLDVDREYRASNREKFREYDKKRYAQNPQLILERNRRSRQKHIEKRLADQKAYYENNKEACLIASKKWAQKNQTKAKSIKAAWKSRNREACLALAQSERDRLTDGYVRQVLSVGYGIPYSAIPHPLVEAKRIQLQITRLLRESKT